MTLVNAFICKVIITKLKTIITIRKWGRCGWKITHEKQYCHHCYQQLCSKNTRHEKAEKNFLEATQFNFVMNTRNLGHWESPKQDFKGQFRVTDQEMSYFYAYYFIYSCRGLKLQITKSSTLMMHFVWLCWRKQCYHLSIRFDYKENAINVVLPLFFNFLLYRPNAKYQQVKADTAKISEYNSVFFSVHFGGVQLPV